MSLPGTSLCIATLCVATTALLIVNTAFNDPLCVQHPSVFSSAFNIIFVLLAWSQVRTLTANNISIPVFIGCSGGYCRRCDIMRADRAHHCSSCNVCILKKDHHCYWLNCCIGYNNYKSFLLFVLYAHLDSLLFNYLAFNYYYCSLSIPWVIAIEMTIIALVSVGTAQLLAVYTTLLLQNTTVVELMQGGKLKCWGGGPGSEHSQGPLPNFIQVFGNNPLLWLLPIRPLSHIGGQFFPNNFN